MAVPVASFTYLISSLNLLEIQFTDRSVGVPLSWSWDFGFKDSSGNKVISILQNPLVIFPTAGTYRVVLTVTNAEGPSLPYDFVMAVGGNVIGISILELILQNSPPGFNPDINFLLAQIKSWQLFLRESLPYVLTDEEVFNEALWPPLFNFLIAKLVVYGYVVINGQAAILSLGSSATSVSGGATLTTKGPVKRVETGPSNAEWYNLSEYWSNLLKAGGSGENIITLMQQEICALAGYLGVSFPFCPKLVTTEPFIVFKPLGICCNGPAITLPSFCYCKPPSISSYGPIV